MDKLKRIYIFIRRPVHRIAWYLFDVFPIRNNKIVFDNFNGVGYADNPKYIAEKFLKMEEKYELIWLVSRRCKMLHGENLPDGIKPVRIHSLSMIYHMATARIWVNNVRLSFYARKRPGQYYVQTWHGSYGGKKSEGDIENQLDLSYIKLAKLDSELADVFLSNSRRMTKHYHKAYWYQGEVLEAGLPRNDILVQNSCQKKSEVRNKIGLEESARVLLYAPTFRKEDQAAELLFCTAAVRKALEKKFGGRWIILNRFHPNLTYLSDHAGPDSTTRDVTEYPDMQELLLAADILITDYSSCYLDFILMKKTVFFYMPDYTSYVKERDFHYDLTKIFVPCAYTPGGLIRVIGEYREEVYQRKLQKFFQWYRFLEPGDAADRTAAWIRGKMEYCRTIGEKELKKAGYEYKNVNYRSHI